MQKELLFWIWLAEALGAANRDFKPLIELYENPYDLFRADAEELERLPSITPRTREALLGKDLSAATAIMDRCERLGIEILTYSAPAFPSALRDIKDPPVLLYYLGKLPDFDHRLSLGLVGTRKMSAYGMRAAYKISYELASAGVIAVSGMAAGIDGVCSAAAIAAKGSTVAILGCGVDVIYPRHHEKLCREILKTGAVLSEYPPGTRPNSYHFPVRNRLISGISQGTVVLEAGLGSGSLITAKDAVLQGRDLFALPANIDSSGAEGTNSLLRDKAKLILDSSDLIEPYRYVYAETLYSERLEKAKSHAAPDLAYLASLGVIEANGGQDRAPAEPQRPAAPTRRRTSPAPKKREAPAAVKESAPKTEPPKAEDPACNLRLSSLTPVQLAVLQAMPDDRAVTVDFLSGLGYPYSDMIAALTMLEILGLVQKLPGALYTKS